METSAYQTMIDMYNEGASLNAIARAYGTYATCVRRILLKHGVELRHDKTVKGESILTDGDELIEWAKAQGRYVTKAELAEHLGVTRLSPSYFKKYPELGKYIKGRGQKEFREDIEKLYKFLADNNIPYKPDDRTKLKVSVTALLLGEYANIALQLTDKASCVSTNRYKYEMDLKKKRALEAGVRLVLISTKDLENLDDIKYTLDLLKFQKET